MKKSTAIMLLFTLLAFNFTNCKVLQKEEPLIFPLDPDIVYNDYSRDAKKADKRYKDKQLVVKGKILEYTTNKLGEVVILVANNNRTNGISSAIQNPNVQIRKPLKKGDSIKIMGMCLGFKQNIQLDNCIILKED